MTRFVPKIQKSRRKESRGQETPALKNSQFPGNFCFFETKFSVSGKFTNFHVTLENFLMSVEISYCQSDIIVFIFISAIECSSIQKFRTQSWNVTYFASFRQINSSLVQNDCGFENYQLQEKFKFQQLEANFDNIRQHNSIFRQKKKKNVHFKTISCEKL